MDFKRFFAAFVGVMLISTMAFAQGNGTLTAVLSDSASGEPVGFATVSISKAGSTEPYKYALSTSEGKVRIEKVASGKYTLKAELLGYKVSVQEIEVKGNLDLGAIKMELDRQTLDAANVSAIGNPIIIKKDTIEYNASSFKTTENDMLVDLLKKLPGIEVAEDGSVTANGETITKITIDGKTFFLDDPQLATKNLPAKIVEKVKVVQKKSEQAEFTGIDDGEEETIIDLSVQKGMLNGLIGNVSAGGGRDFPKSTDGMLDDTDWRYQGGAFVGKFAEHSQISLILNGNNTNNRGFNDLAGNMMQGMRGGGGGMGRGQGGWGGGNGITRSWMGGLNGAWDLFDDKMNLGANYLYNNTNRYVQERSIARTTVDESTDLVYRRGLTDPGTNVTNTYGNRFGMRLEHKFSENTSILFQPQVNFGSGNYREFTDFETTREGTGASELTNKGFSDNSGENKNWQTNGFFLFRQRLGIPGRTISFMGNYSFSQNDMDGFNQSLTETYREGTAYQNIVNQRIDQYSNSSSLSGRLVYTEPLGRGFYVSANYSYRWSQNKSVKDAYNSGSNVLGGNSLAYDPVGEKKDDTYSSEILNRYRNQNGGVDLQYQKDKLHAQVGMSVMPTKTHNETNGKDYDSNVTNWAPSAMLWYDINDNTNVRFFYRGQSSQPSTSQLMAVPDNSNPLNITLGNPGLVPYFRHNLRSEFRMTDKKTFTSVNLNLNGGFVQDPIVSALWYDQSGVQYNMPVNGPSSHNGDIRLFVNAPIAKSNFSVFSMTNSNYSQSASYIGKTSFSMDKYLNSEGVFTDQEQFIKDYPDLGKSDNFMQNKTTSFGFTQRLRLTYRNDAVEIMAGGRTRLNRAWYSIDSKEDIKTWSNQVDGSVNWTLPAGFTFKAEANYNWYRGYEAARDPEVIVNLDIQKLLFQNKVTLAVRAYDLLDQAKNLSVSTSGNTYTETWNNTLGRYVIVALTYRFGTFGKGANRMRMGSGGPMGGYGGRGGGRPSGPPPMM